MGKAITQPRKKKQHPRYLCSNVRYNFNSLTLGLTSFSLTDRFLPSPTNGTIFPFSFMIQIWNYTVNHMWPSTELSLFLIRFSLLNVLRWFHGSACPSVFLTTSYEGVFLVTTTIAIIPIFCIFSMNTYTSYEGVFLVTTTIAIFPIFCIFNVNTCNFQLTLESASREREPMNGKSKRLEYYIVSGVSRVSGASEQT